MESTHDLDFLLWLLEPAKPVRVYSQGVRRVMYPKNGAVDQQWIMVTLDNGCVIRSAAAGACRPAIRISPPPGSR